MTSGGFVKKLDKVNMDAKQRICLGRLLSKEEREAFSSFRVYREAGNIVLVPLVEVPATTHWIYKNPKAMASLQRGLEDIKAGRVSELDRDFSEFLEDDEI